MKATPHRRRSSKHHLTEKAHLEDRSGRNRFCWTESAQEAHFAPKCRKDRGGRMKHIRLFRPNSIKRCFDIERSGFCSADNNKVISLRRSGAVSSLFQQISCCLINSKKTSYYKNTKINWPKTSFFDVWDRDFHIHVLGRRQKIGKSQKKTFLSSKRTTLRN